MCSPSAISASEPNSAPPTISAIIMTVQSAITAQVRRSARFVILAQEHVVVRRKLKQLLGVGHGVPHFR